MSDTPGNIETEVRQLISDVTGRDVEELKPEVNFWQDLGVDSIKAIEITVALEKKFKIRVRDEQIPKITTVADCILVVKDALAKNNG